MNRLYTAILSLILLLAGAAVAEAAPNAAQILQKSANALLKSKGVTASYTYKSGSYTEKGKLSAKGKKFTLSSPQRSFWYNGKSLWTLDPSEKEVTLSAPTASEVASMNPYLLVSSYKADFTAKLVKSTIKGTYSIQLTPKNSRYYIKNATLCIRASNYMPVRLDITDRNGAKSSITVTGVQTGVTLSDAIFTYNAKSHPGVQLIDLR